MCEVWQIMFMVCSTCNKVPFLIIPGLKFAMLANSMSLKKWNHCEILIFQFSRQSDFKSFKALLHLIPNGEKMSQDRKLGCTNETGFPLSLGPSCCLLSINVYHPGRRYLVVSQAYFPTLPSPRWEIVVVKWFSG